MRNMRPIEIISKSKNAIKLVLRHKIKLVRRHQTGKTISYTAIAFLLSIIGIITGNTPSYAQQTATRFEECRASSEDEFRHFIQETTSTNLSRSVESLDMFALVSAEWNRLGLDTRYRDLVHTVIKQEKANKSYVDKLLSTYSQSTSEEMAHYVITRVFNGPEFQEISTRLGEAVAKAIAATPATQEATRISEDAALNCLEAFLDFRYTGTVAKHFEAELPQLSAAAGSVSGISSTSAIINISSIVLGIVALVMRRLIARFLASLTARIIGRISLRIAAAFTGIGALAFLAYDLWTGADGPYPAIAEELLKADTRQQILVSYSDSLKQEILQNIQPTAAKVSNALYDRYVEFTKKYNTLLHLTETNSRIREQVGRLDPRQFAQLAELVDLTEENSGEAGVVTAFDRGKMRDALSLSAAGMTIARDTQSIDIALTWQAKLPGKLDVVVDTDMHRALSPADFGADRLLRLVAAAEATGDIQNLLALSKDNIQALQILPQGLLNDAVKTLSPNELEHLATTMMLIREPEIRTETASVAISSRNGRKLLASGLLSNAIAGSTNKIAVLRAIENSSLTALPGQIEQVLAGDIAPSLLRTLHPWLIWVAAAFALIALGIVASVLRPVAWLLKMLIVPLMALFKSSQGPKSRKKDP